MTISNNVYDSYNLYYIEIVSTTIKRFLIHQFEFKNNITIPNNVYDSYNSRWNSLNDNIEILIWIWK